MTGRPHTHDSTRQSYNAGETTLNTDTRPPTNNPIGTAIAQRTERRRSAGKPPGTIPVAKSDPESELTPQEQEVARQQWRTGKCTWCGGLHMRACPRVAAFEFANDGKTVVKVEFWPDGQWPDANVVWPEDMGWSEDDPAPG